ncbi:MAG: four helix bundle protein [Armatimonadota bacterium]
MAFLFQKLDVYRRAVDFAEEIGRMTDAFPRGSFYLADQLRRASVSISANIAEGNGRWHVGDRKSFFYIARGSACECVPLLDICVRRKLVDARAHEALLQTLDDLVRMLTGLAAGAEKRRGATGAGDRAAGQPEGNRGCSVDG